jgi:hypothetical protein
MYVYIHVHVCMYFCMWCTYVPCICICMHVCVHGCVMHIISNPIIIINDKSLFHHSFHAFKLLHIKKNMYVHKTCLIELATITTITTIITILILLPQNKPLGEKKQEAHVHTYRDNNCLWLESLSSLRNPKPLTLKPLALRAIQSNTDRFSDHLLLAEAKDVTDLAPDWNR